MGVRLPPTHVTTPAPSLKLSFAISTSLAGLALSLAMALVGGCRNSARDVKSDRAAQVYRNPGPGMEPTIRAGQEVRAVFFPDTTIAAAEVQRGELVVHAFPPDTSRRFIKRVVGLPGDTLAMAQGVLHVNGTPVTESYAYRDEPAVDPAVPEFDWQRAYLVAAARDTAAKYVASRNTWGPLVVPAGQYFVLGDNRDHSLDSRYWGFLPLRHVLALVDLSRR